MAPTPRVRVARAAPDDAPVVLPWCARGAPVVPPIGCRHPGSLSLELPPVVHPWCPRGAPAPPCPTEKCTKHAQERVRVCTFFGVPAHPFHSLSSPSSL